MIYANESAANSLDIENIKCLGGEDYRSVAPRDCCLGVVSSADGTKVKSDVKVVSNAIVGGLQRDRWRRYRHDMLLPSRHADAQTRLSQPSGRHAAHT